MMRQTLGVDADELVDEEEEVTDEEPPEEHDEQNRDKLFEEQNLVEDHRTREEGEIAPLDALYPMMQVLSDDKKQQTKHRMSPMHETTYQEDVKNETYRETRSSAKNMVMTALYHPRDHKTHTTRPALMTMTYQCGEQVKKKEQEGHKKIKMIPFATEGEEGHS